MRNEFNSHHDIVRADESANYVNRKGDTAMLRSKSVVFVLSVFLALAVIGCQAGKTPETVKKAAVGGDAEEGKVVAEVGGEKITLEKLDEMIQDLPPQFQAMAASRKGEFLDSVIDEKLLYAKALSENIDKDPKVKRQLEQISKQVVISELLRKEMEQKIRISDEDAKNYYEANKDQYTEQEKYRASHILVDTEQEAKDLIVRLNAGEDFAALAKEKSKCPSKEKGGDLGLASKGQMVPEFEAAALSLEPGKISDVVKTQFGYHIIRLEEKQPSKERSFEEVKEQVKQTLLPLKQKEYFEAMIKELKNKNKVVVHEEVLQQATQQTPAAPADSSVPVAPAE